MCQGTSDEGGRRGARGAAALARALVRARARARAVDGQGQGHGRAADEAWAVAPPYTGVAVRPVAGQGQALDDSVDAGALSVQCAGRRQATGKHWLLVQLSRPGAGGAFAGTNVLQ